MIIGFIGNALTLKIIFFNASLRTSSNYLIASLAVADFAMSLVSSPIILGVVLYSQWIYSKAICNFHGFVGISLACASLHNMALMAINRYIRVVKSSKYNKHFSVRKTVIYIVIVWALSLGSSLLYLAIGNDYTFHPGKYFCFLDINDYYFTTFMVTCFIAIPAAGITYCYYQVYKVIRKHNIAMTKWGRSSQNITAQEINITRTLFFIVIMFLCCWIPLFVMDMIDVSQLRWSLPREAYASYTFLACVSGCVNPIIYVILNPTFRKEYLRILCLQGRCSRGVNPTVTSRNGVNDGTTSNNAQEH